MLSRPGMVAACSVLAFLAVAFAQQARADDVSDRYAYERWRQERERQSPWHFGMDLGASAWLFDYNFRSTNGGGQDLHWSGDALEEPPLAFSWEAKATIQTGWYDYFTFEYQGLMLQTYEDKLDFDLNFERSVVPSGADLDIGTQLHHLTLQYRRDVFFLDSYEKSRVFGTVGLSYDIVNFEVDSDSFPLKRNSRRMQELLPLPVLGAGFSTALTGSLTATGYVRGMYLPKISTMQKRYDAKVKQESQFYEAAVEVEWRLSKWFNVTFFARWQLWQHELAAAEVDQLFKMNGAQLGIRIGLRL